MKIGVIDVGGGLRDIYGAGVFDRCMDDGVKFDYCIGVSAGSANLISYLAGQRGRNYRFYTEYPSRKEYMGISPFLKYGSFLNLDYIYGIMSNSDGEDPLDYEAFEKNESTFIVVSIDAKTGETIYFDRSNFSKNNYQVLMASSSIPGFCKWRKIGDRVCTDGGVGDPIPIEKAFADGCDKVVVVLTLPDGPMGLNKRDQFGSKLFKITKPEVSKLLKIRNEIYNRQLELAHEYEKQGKCLIICPDDICGVGTITKDPERLKILYQKGYDDAEKIKEFISAKDDSLKG